MLDSMKQPVIEEVYIDNMLQRVNYLSKVIHKDKKGRFVNVYNKKYYLDSSDTYRVDHKIRINRFYI